MARIGKLALNIVSVLAFVVGAWQVLGLIPVLTWIKAPNQITAEMWVILIVKLIWLALCWGIFVGARWLKRKLMASAQGASASSKA